MEDVINEIIELKKKLEEKKDESLEELKSHFDKVVDALGLSPKEIFNQIYDIKEKKDKRTRSSVKAPKYINPDNPDNTWTGSGGEAKAPSWVKTKQAEGVTLKDLLNKAHPRYKEFLE